jgi:hypothetical protein
MLVANVHVVDWEIPMGDATPLIVTTGNESRIFTSRRGSYMFIEGDAAGVGEMVEPVFALPGEDPATILFEARQLLHECTSRLVGTIVGKNWIDDVKHVVHNCISPASRASPMSIRLTRFCVEQALLTFVAHHRSIPLRHILREYIGIPVQSGIPEEGVVRLNAMFNMRDDSDIGVLPRGVIKLKVGGGKSTPQNDAHRVNAVAAQLVGQGHPLLRLDANQSWSINEYQDFLESLTPHAVSFIQYIEEPFKVESADEMCGKLRAVSAPPPLALDESLLFPKIESILQERKHLRIINKVFLHGISCSNPMFLDNTRTTITCTFETGVGLAFLVSLAFAVNQEKYHGIHALPQMIASCPITKEFSDLMQNDQDGLFIAVKKAESLLKKFSPFS